MTHLHPRIGFYRHVDARSYRLQSTTATAAHLYVLFGAAGTDRVTGSCDVTAWGVGVCRDFCKRLAMATAHVCGARCALRHASRKQAMHVTRRVRRTGQRRFRTSLFRNASTVLVALSGEGVSAQHVRDHWLLSVS